MTRNLYIVTHWAKELDANPEWKWFVVADDAPGALASALDRSPWKTDGQLHVSQVSEFIESVQP